jgi:hypothetical protein
MRILLAFANSFLAVLTLVTLFSFVPLSKGYPRTPSLAPAPPRSIDSLSVSPATPSPEPQPIIQAILPVEPEDQLRYRITYYDDTDDIEHTVEVSNLTTENEGDVTPDVNLRCHDKIRNFDFSDWHPLSLQAAVSMENQGRILTLAENSYFIQTNAVGREFYFDRPWELLTEGGHGKTTTPFQVNFASGQQETCYLYERQLVSFYNAKEDQVDTGYGRIIKIEFLYDTTSLVRKPPPTPTIIVPTNVVYRVKYFTLKKWYGNLRLESEEADRVHFSSGSGENGETWGTGPLINQIPCKEGSISAAGLYLLRNTTQYPLPMHEIVASLPDVDLGPSHKVQIEKGNTAYTCTLDGLHTLRFGGTTLYWPQIEYIQFIEQR